MEPETRARLIDQILASPVIAAAILAGALLISADMLQSAKLYIPPISNKVSGELSLDVSNAKFTRSPFRIETSTE